MVRYHKNQCTKSNGKIAIKKKWSSAWKSCDKRDVDIVLFDGSSLIQRISQFEDSNLEKTAEKRSAYSIDIENSDNEEEQGKPKYENYTDGLLSTDENGILYKSLHNGITEIGDILRSSFFNRNVSTVVLCFDKSNYVPISKGQTQNDRNKEKEERIAQLPELILDLDMRLTSTWNDYLSKRGYTRNEMIRFVCKHLLDPKGPARINWPLNIELIVDGHCLEASDVEEWGIQCEDQNIHLSDWMENEHELNDYPIKMTLKNQKLNYSFEKRLHNKIGEFDYNAFYLAKTMSNIKGGSPVIEIQSVDTDMIYLSMIYLYKDLQRIQSGEVTDDLTQIFIHGKGDYLDVNHLVTLIHKDIPQLENASVYLSFIMQLGGCDFLDGHWWIPHMKFLDGFLELAPKMKNQITFDKRVSINGNLYVEFMLNLYKKLHKTRIANDTHVTASNFNKFLGAYGNKKEIDPNKWFPTQEDCVYAVKQWIYVSNMMLCVGDSDVDLLDPMKYAYVKIDPEKPISKDNIKRKILPEILPVIKERKPRTTKYKRVKL